MGAGQKRPRPQSNEDGQGSRPRSGTGAGADAASGGMSLFSPPILRSAALTASHSLNKALFAKIEDIAAARVHDVRHIAKYQKALQRSRDLLQMDRIHCVVDDPEAPVTAPDAVAGGAKPTPKRKCLLLKPSVSPTAPEQWSSVIKEGVASDEIRVIPYKLRLDYDYWSVRDILVSVLPEEFHDDIPTGFNTAGHVAHLNLRERFQPYKYLVGQLLLDKNPVLRTVINKIDDVGTASAFRTFRYEVLAGVDDMDVEVRENLCTYRFDYSKVYWNSKLEPEHTRLLKLFRPGQVVADVMAGIGPFAVPAGKRGVFVWANDMNPESYAALCHAIQRNKVAPYVRAFNEDGLQFIRRAADLVRAASAAGESVRGVPDPLAKKEGPVVSQKKKGPAEKKPAAPPRPLVPVPPTIDHFVMNLPASAITFLPRFRGLYAGHQDLFLPAGGDGAPSTAPPRLPIVHVHCFAVKNVDDQSVPKNDVRARVSAELGVDMTLCARYADVEEEAASAAAANLVYVHNVRDVAPKKTMYCASFRLPAAVAFAEREAETDKEESGLDGEKPSGR